MAHYRRTLENGNPFSSLWVSLITSLLFLYPSHPPPVLFLSCAPFPPRFHFCSTPGLGFPLIFLFLLNSPVSMLFTNLGFHFCFSTHYFHNAIHGTQATLQQRLFLLESLQSWGLSNGPFFLFFFEWVYWIAASSLFSLDHCVFSKTGVFILIISSFSFWGIMSCGYVRKFSSVCISSYLYFYTLDAIMVFYLLGFYCSLWWTFTSPNKMMILIIMGIVVRMRAEVAKVGSMISDLVCFVLFYYGKYSLSKGLLLCWGTKSQVPCTDWDPREKKKEKEEKEPACNPA